MDNTRPGAGAQPWQLGNSFSTNHEFNIKYPCLDLLGEDEECFLLSPERQDERYKPLPLIPNASLQENYPLLGADTEITVLRQVDSVLSKQQISWVHHRQSHSLDRDLDAVCAHVGSSEIKVVVYFPVGIANRTHADLRIRVSRTTTFKHVGGETTVLPEAIYESMATEWCGVQPNEVRYRIWDLILQLDDRQVRHVMKTLADAGIAYDDEVNDMDWQRPRFAQPAMLRRKLKSVTTELDLQGLQQLNETLPADEKILTCPSCTDLFEDLGSSSKIILPPCSEKHAICRDCFKTWCDTKDVSQPNYLDIDAEFVEDVRFVPYEQDPRRFADIDSRLAQNDDTLIKVHGEGLLTFWEEVFDQGYESDKWDKVSEHEQFQRGFVRALQENNGAIVSRKALWCALLHGVMREMHDEHKRQALDIFHDDPARQLMESSPLLTPLRSGYRAFIEKQLNRIIAFSHVRICHEHSCRSDDMFCLHWHGDRKFWNPSNVTMD